MYVGRGGVCWEGGVFLEGRGSRVCLEGQCMLGGWGMSGGAGYDLKGNVCL